MFKIVSGTTFCFKLNTRKHVIFFCWRYIIWLSFFSFYLLILKGIFKHFFYRCWCWEKNSYIHNISFSPFLPSPAPFRALAFHAKFPSIAIFLGHMVVLQAIKCYEKEKNANLLNFKSFDSLKMFENSNWIPIPT